MTSFFADPWPAGARDFATCSRSVAGAYAWQAEAAWRAYRLALAEGRQLPRWGAALVLDRLCFVTLPALALAGGNWLPPAGPRRRRQPALPLRRHPQSADFRAPRGPSGLLWRAQKYAL